MKRTGFKIKARKPLRKRRKGTFKHKAWDVFSQFIRRREMNEDGMVKCISCPKWDFWKNMDAGHYVPKSVSLALRFSEIAVQNQCTGCNRFRHGNITQYALALRKKYGEDILEKLDQIRRDNQGFKISEAEYESIFDHYKAKLAEMTGKVTPESQKTGLE